MTNSYSINLTINSSGFCTWIITSSWNNGSFTSPFSNNFTPNFFLRLLSCLARKNKERNHSCLSRF